MSIVWENRKGNLATPIDEQASINTPETSRGTVSDNTISQPESKVKSKTSNSQTSEKKSDTKTPEKSKGKAADDVYEKGRKLKVGDKVGEVKLVADESGKPITPVLRASFDLTDVPSYILATVEATGDTALIAELEEETALMMMGDLTGERAQLPLHDAVEALSEHVRDGDITPEQAAHILSEECAHPTGADVDTLIERENMSSVKYMVAGNNSLTADESMLEDAQMRWGIDSREEIIRDTGWWFDDVDGKWKYEISDSEMKYDPNGFVDSPHSLVDYIKHETLFEAYPQLKSVEVRFTDLRAQKENGTYNPQTNVITLDQTRSKQQQKETLVHEIQHAVQHIEDFASGANAEIAYIDLFIKEYKKVKDSPEFKNLPSVDERIDFIDNSIHNDEKLRDNIAKTHSRNSHGEIEARETSDRLSMKLRELRQNTRRINSSPKIDKKNVYRELVDILSELGYTEIESDNETRKFGITNDEQRYADKSNTSVQSRYDRYVRRGVDGVGEVFDNRRWGQTRGVSGRSEPLGGIDTGTDETGTRQYVDGIKYSIALPDTDTVAAIDREARAKSIVALANSLQDGVQNDAEYAALERVKGNAESIVQKYDELSKLKAELKDVSFSEGPRDTARITELRNEIDSVNRSINYLERGLTNARTAAPFKNMLQRKVQGSTAKARHDYYERQKARAESRKNTETKNKTLRQIQKLRNRLANPTKSRNVVNGMQELASSALTLANAVFSGATNESIPNFPCFISLYFFSLHIVEQGE